MCTNAECWILNFHYFWEQLMKKACKLFTKLGSLITKATKNNGKRHGHTD